MAFEEGEHGRDPLPDESRGDQVADPPPVIATIHVPATAVLRPEPDGRFSVSVPALPGCYSQGDTLEDALSNIREAAEGWLLVRHDLATGALKVGPGR